MKQHRDVTEIDFTDQIKKLDTENSQASSDKDQCNNEDCGDCGCENEESEAEHYDELEGHDMECPSCGCALGKMYLKAGMMRRSMYASKYSDLYDKVKAADPQHDPEKMPEIKTTFDSKKKIEDHPNAVELRDVDEPLGYKENKLKEN